jgi:hypothetical protein
VKKAYLLFGIGIITAALCAGAYVRWTRNVPEPAIASFGGSDSLDVRIDSIPYWLQYDPQWGHETIGGSNESMAEAGCTVTCVAMVLSSFGYQTDPLQLCRDLKARNGFTEDGYVIWSTVESIANRGIAVEFPALRHDAIDALLHEGTPVLAKVMLRGTIPHWVLIVGKTGKEFLIIDPLNGQQSRLRLSERSEKIYALRVLRRL